MDPGPEQARARPFPEGLPTQEGEDMSREAHLETIRSLLDSGSYDVPAMAVAERMLDRAAAARPGQRDQEL